MIESKQGRNAEKGTDIHTFSWTSFTAIYREPTSATSFSSTFTMMSSTLVILTESQNGLFKNKWSLRASIDKTGWFTLQHDWRSTVSKLRYALWQLPVSLCWQSSSRLWWWCACKGWSWFFFHLFSLFPLLVSFILFPRSFFPFFSFPIFSPTYLFLSLLLFPLFL